MENKILTYTTQNTSIPNWGYDSRNIFLDISLEHAGNLKIKGEDINTWFLRITCAWSDTPVVIYDNSVFYLSRDARKEYSERTMYFIEDNKYLDENNAFDDLAFLKNFPHITLSEKVQIYDLYGDMSGSREFLVTSQLI